MKAEKRRPCACHEVLPLCCQVSLDGLLKRSKVCRVSSDHRLWPSACDNCSLPRQVVVLCLPAFLVFVVARGECLGCVGRGNYGDNGVESRLVVAGSDMCFNFNTLRLYQHWIYCCIYTSI
ncbi:hypothetical protein MRB53_039009 [Persea americana]|nr:hypothetical protein MRB53_039009 [Persea americana]